MSWKLKNIKKLASPRESLLIGGLPGIGNVGKLAVDFLIDDLKADKVCEIFSPTTHNCVFVNDENLIELPIISIYHKKVKNKDIFFLAGDIQPIDGASCHTFCNEIINFCAINKCKEIITLGGVGIKEIPKKPKVYFTGNNKAVLNKYNNSKILNQLSGQIIGVSGLLVGLANNKKIRGVSILAETFAQPNYIGVKGAKEILNILDNKLRLGLNKERMKKELKELEQTNHDISNEEDFDFLEDLQEEDLVEGLKEDKDMNYIG